MCRSVWGVAVLALAAAAPPAEARQCSTMGATELVAGVRYCVDSVLGSQSGNAYGPQNLFDGNPGTAWCEGASGSGAGQRIVLTISNGAPFDRLIVWSGYQKSSASFVRNARPRTIVVSTTNGPDVQYKLPDAKGQVTLRLPKMAQREHVVITIKDVYPGARFKDMCISGLYPDFESGRNHVDEGGPEPGAGAGAG